MDKACYNGPKNILLITYGGGSNSFLNWLWELEIQKFSDDTKMQIRICHFPPGTCKWKKIEHILFSFISINWLERPLASL